MKRKLAAEFVGTAMLLISVIGSGIMGVELAQGNDAITLLANAIATGCMLFVIITVLGHISGAHFNPAVSLAFYLRSELSAVGLASFSAAQVVGAVFGVWAAHLMFDLPLLQLSQTMHRTGAALYIMGAYWFTSSTSFANPAVTFARGFSDTFAGIYPGHIAMFILAQLAATLIGHVALKWVSDE